MIQTSRQRMKLATNVWSATIGSAQEKLLIGCSLNHEIFSLRKVQAASFFNFFLWLIANDSFMPKNFEKSLCLIP